LAEEVGLRNKERKKERKKERLTAKMIKQLHEYVSRVFNRVQPILFVWKRK
jgi:hypothetical protein